jgi:outer membrane protein assembly factor BamA
MLKYFSPIILFCFLQIKVSGIDSCLPDTLVVDEIKIEGNFVTNKKIIFRELAFKLNETIDRDDIEYLRKTSINNLTKTSLFNFIEIAILEEKEGIMTIIVRLTERWYIWPSFYLNHTDRNFSEWWRTKDLSKLEYGIGVKIFNFRGMAETLSLNYRMGNFTKYELDYRGINLDKAERNSLSFLVSWSSKKVLPYMIQSDKQVVLKENYNLTESIILKAKYKYRRGYFNSHIIEFGYTENRIADTIYSLNPYYFGLGNHEQKYFNLKYEFRSDNRDSYVYPKTGYMFVAGIEKKGLHFLTDEFRSIDLYGQFYKYHKIAKRFYMASGIWFATTFADDYIFYSETGLGYLQFVRGYEYYAVNGSFATVFKNLLKFEILPMKVINLKIWPIRKLYQFNKIPVEIYSNLFFDAGYVHDNFGINKRNNNKLVDKLMYGTGVGIDFVTYYDKVLRLDYSFNGLGESGLFIHWKAAIR